MPISFEPSSNVRRNSRLIIGASIVLAIIFVINAVISGYLLRRNTTEDRADQLATLTLILSEHTSQIIFSANTVLNSIDDIFSNNIISINKNKPCCNIVRFSNFPGLSSVGRSNCYRWLSRLRICVIAGIALASYCPWTRETASSCCDRRVSIYCIGYYWESSSCVWEGYGVRICTTDRDGWPSINRQRYSNSW